MTGRHGFFASYESFAGGRFNVDGILNGCVKPVLIHGAKISGSECDRTSTVFQQDHNGYTHQDPGILTHLAEKSLNLSMNICQPMPIA